MQRKDTFYMTTGIARVIMLTVFMITSCTFSLLAGELYFREQNDVADDIEREQSIKKLLDRFEGKVEEKDIVVYDKEKQMLEDKVDTLQGDIADKNEQLENLEMILQENQRQRTELENSLQGYSKKEDALAAQLELLLKENESLKDQLERKQQMHAARSEEAIEKEKDLKDTVTVLKNNIMSKEQEIADLETLLIDNQKAKKELEERMEEYIQKEGFLSTTIERLRQKNEELEKEIAFRKKTKVPRYKGPAKIYVNGGKELMQSIDELYKTLANQTKLPAIVTQSSVMPQPKVDEVALYEKLAIAYVRAKMYAEAIDAYHALLSINPKHAHTYYYLGLLYQYVEHDSEKAVSALKKYIECAPQGKYAEKAHTLIELLEQE